MHKEQISPCRWLSLCCGSLGNTLGKKGNFCSVFIFSEYVFHLLAIWCPARAGGSAAAVLTNGNSTSYAFCKICFPAILIWMYLGVIFQGEVGFARLAYDFPNCCPDYVSPFLNAARSSHFPCTSNMVTSVLAISLQTVLPSPCILCNKSLNLMHFTLCNVMVVVGLMFICKGVLL